MTPLGPPHPAEVLDVRRNALGVGIRDGYIQGSPTEGTIPEGSDQHFSVDEPVISPGRVPHIPGGA